VIDTSGKIRYAYWDPDYKTRVNEQELLEAARRLK
jgi:peroxiredoxin